MRTLFVALPLLAAVVASPLQAQHPQDLIGTARSAGQFATLLAAVDAAGLTNTLRGRGPLTVFAPTDEAFRRLPAGTVESLLRPENRDQLRALLLYHVVPGSVSSAAARTLTTATTVEGRAIRLRADGNQLRINGATVVKADVNASNGIIHVIDEVLMPTTASVSSEPMRTASRGTERARDLLDLAIRRGVPLYNDGQPAATSAIYEVAARGVIALGEDVPSGARETLERGLRDADRERDTDEKAWIMRRAIDDAFKALEGRARRTMSPR